MPAPGGTPSTVEAGGAGRPAAEWPLWEVFVRARRGLSHNHVGSLHAPDAQLALRNARDVYTRRQEGGGADQFSEKHRARLGQPPQYQLRIRRKLRQDGSAAQFQPMMKIVAFEQADGSRTHG